MFFQLCGVQSTQKLWCFSKTQNHHNPLHKQKKITQGTVGSFDESCTYFSRQKVTWRNLVIFFFIQFFQYVLFSTPLGDQYLAEYCFSLLCWKYRTRIFWHFRFLMANDLFVVFLFVFNRHRLRGAAKSVRPTEVMLSQLQVPGASWEDIAHMFQMGNTHMSCSPSAGWGESPLLEKKLHMYADMSTS